MTLSVVPAARDARNNPYICQFCILLKAFHGQSFHILLVVCRQASRHFGAPASQKEAKDPGLTRYSETFRQAQLKDLFVADSGQIPKQREFSYYLPCTVAHPGLCAQRDGALLVAAKEHAKWLYAVAVKEKLHGHFLRFRIELGAWTRESWALVAHSRGSGPRLLMVGPAQLETTSRRLSMAEIDDRFDYMKSVSFFGLILREAPSIAGLQVALFLKSFPI